MNQISLPVAELKPALVGLGKIISRRATLPVLGMLKVKRTKDGWITITSTDLERFITVRLEEPSKGAPLSILVPHEDLSTLAKAGGRGESISIEKADGDKAIIRFPIGDQQAEEHVLSLPVVEFPAMPKIKSEPVSLPDTLRGSLHQAMECASTDETRFILNSAYIDVSDRKCQQIVATNGMRLYSSNSFSLPLKDSIIIPSNKFLGWREFNADGGWQLRVQPGEKKGEPDWLQISSRRWRYITRQIEGNYPNWRQCVPDPKAYKLEVEFDPTTLPALITTVERMPDGDKVNHGIKIEVADGKVFLVAKASGEPVKVEVSKVKTKGINLTFCLNRNFLIQAFGFGMHHLQASDQLSPVRLSDNAGHQMVIMTIRTDAAPLTKPAAATPVKESNGAGSAPAVSPPPPPTIERSQTPMQASTNGSYTNGNEPASEPTKPALEAAVEQIEAAKVSLRTTKETLNQLLDTLKQAQRDQKSTSREVQSVRSTLERLQSVRI